MDGLKAFFTASLMALFVLQQNLYSAVTITVTESAAPYILAPADLQAISDSMSAVVNPLLTKFGPGLNDAMPMLNATGYPLGASILDGTSFNHFYIGVAASAALANTRGFSITALDINSLPAGLVNSTLFFGFSLGKKADLAVKLMWFDTTVINTLIPLPSLAFGPITLGGFTTYAAGVKARFDVIPRKQLLPGIILFGGLRINASVDASYGQLSLQGQMPMPIPDMVIPNPAFPPFPPPTYTLQIAFTPTFSLASSWLLIYGSVETEVSMSIASFLDAYFGIGVMGGYGMTSTRITLGGTMTTNNPDWQNPPISKPDDRVIDLAVVSVDSATTPYILPYLKTGLEVNIFLVRITIEGQANILNLEDVGVQLAVRTQW